MGVGREAPTERLSASLRDWGFPREAPGQAQVYSTVHVSPVWLRGWRRGPVGVTTEARVYEGWWAMGERAW